MGKYFLVNEKIESLSRTDILSIEQDKLQAIDDRESTVEQIAEKVLSEDDNLKAPEGRVIIKINTESKNYHNIGNGVQLRRERRFNNLNRRETESCNAFVIDAENIPKGTEVLVYFNSVIDTNKIFDYKDKSPYISYYSIKEEDCYLEWDGATWKPLDTYETALRVFKPYEGVLENVAPTLVKDVLYVTSGDLKGNIVKTLKGCDLQVVFQEKDGREGNIIVFRPYGNPKLGLEEEAIAILDEYNKLLKKGKLIVGLTPNNAKKLEI